MALVVEATGFPDEEIQPNMRLLEELSLDSIKAGELIARLGEENALAEDALDPVELGNATIQELAAAVLAAVVQAGGGKPAVTIPVAATPAAAV